MLCFIAVVRGGNWPNALNSCRAIGCAFGRLAGEDSRPGLRRARVDAGTVQFISASTSVNENAGSLALTVARAGEGFGPASVKYATQNGTAIAGPDYTAASGELIWAAGDTGVKTITLPISGDALVEGDETFAVRLSNPSGATLGSPSSASVTIADNDRDYSGHFGLVGYLPYYRMDGINSSIGSNCTDIIFAFIWPASDGALDLSCLTSGRIAALQAFKNSGARILVSAGGAGLSSNFGLVTADAAARAAFIQRLLNLCRSLDLDGIDFDWEFPADAAEEHNYAVLLYETRQAFQAYGFLVTVALNADLQIDYQAMQAAGYSMVDRVHLMSYARANSLGYHSTYAQSATDVERLLCVAGVPNQKLYLGVPFYGRYISNQDIYRTYAQIAGECHNPADNVDLVTYPGIGDIYFNGVGTIKQKTRHAIGKQLGGIMIWELGQDTAGMTLLNAIKDAVTNNPQTPLPDIKANDLDANIAISRGTPVKISVNMDAGNYAGTPADWWVVALAGSSWYYLNSSLQWTPFDGKLSNCRPLYQGALFNLPVTDLLNTTALPAGLYTFWFAVDSPMDGILNADGPILADSMNVAVLAAPPVPCVKANGATGEITVNYPETATITVEMNAQAYAGTPADWWILLRAGSSWYYLDSSMQWIPDDNMLHWQPVCRGALGNLPATPVLTGSLPRGTYDLYFAVDFPMDGLLNVEQIWSASVKVNVQ